MRNLTAVTIMCLLLFVFISNSLPAKYLIAVDTDTGDTYEVSQIEIDGDNNASLTLDLLFSADWIYKIGKIWLLYVNELEDELANNVTIAQLKEAVESYGIGDGDMTKAVYDTEPNNRVDTAESVDDGTNSATAEQIKQAVDLYKIESEIATQIEAYGYIAGNETITLSGDVSGSGATAITTTIGANKILNTMIAAEEVYDSDLYTGTGANQINTADIPELTNLYYTEARVSANTDVTANTAKVTESTTVTSPLVKTTYDLSIPAATNAAAGHATAAHITALEANTAKVTESTTVTSPLVLTTYDISIPVADTTNSGYLSTTDWDTFNDKQTAGNYITALTGHVTASGPGSAAATIAADVITNAMIRADEVYDSDINWGAGANQVSMDDIGDGSTNAAITLTQEAAYDSVVTADPSDYDEYSDLPVAVVTDNDVTHIPNCDNVYDWVIGLGYVTSEVDPTVDTSAEIIAIVNAGAATDFEHEVGGLEADVSAYSGLPKIDSGTTTELKINWSATVAPAAATDDVTLGYIVGSRWLDTTADKEYVCLDNTDGAAVWTETTGAGAGGSSEWDDQTTYLEPKGAGQSVRTKDAFELVDDTNKIDLYGTALGIIAANQIYASVGTIESFYIHDTGIVDFAKQSRCGAYLTASQTISHATTTKVTLGSEEYDYQNEFDSATNNRFTAKEAGTYMVIGKLGWDSVVANKTYMIHIWKNGSGVKRQELQTSSSNFAWVGNVIVANIVLAQNDYLELYAYQYSGVSDTLYPGSIYTYMEIAKLF